MDASEILVFIDADARANSFIKLNADPYVCGGIMSLMVSHKDVSSALLTDNLQNERMHLEIDSFCAILSMVTRISLLYCRFRGTYDRRTSMQTLAVILTTTNPLASDLFRLLGFAQNAHKIPTDSPNSIYNTQRVVPIAKSTTQVAKILPPLLAISI